jgi:signal transduction histidine kinase
MIGAHRRHALADLARGVAHDLNNAMGEMLPLVQQMQVDLAEPGFERAVLEQDLVRVHSSLQVCRRIFGSMLRFARDSQRTIGWGSVAKAIESTCAVLEESLQRQRVALVRDLPERVPEVRCGQSDLEQLFLNLATNAREAMPDGGTLRITVRDDDNFVEVRFADDGRGIPAELLAEIEQPFFTTKPAGTGLGLSTCRAIVSEARGEMTIVSEPDRGTTITVRLPRTETRG